MKLFNLWFCTPNTPLISENINSNTTVIDYFLELSDAQIQNDLIDMVNIFADCKGMLNRLASNIHFILHATWEPIVRKDYFVVSTTSRFPCVMLCPI